MDTESVYASLVSENLYTSDHLKALYMNQSSYTVDSLKKASIDEITLCLSESLHIRDVPNTSAATIFSPPFDNGDKLYTSNDADVEDEVEIDCTEVTPQKELIKSATFPCSSKLQLSTNFSDGKTEEGVNNTAAEIKIASSESSMTAHSRSISLPVPLVSAIKGTREKLGTPRDKRSVTWAPDVYDPPPSAPSTAVLNPKQRRRSDRKKMIDNSKKNGKSKQKKKSSSKGSSSSSSSSSSKDKRQVQKYSRGSNVFYKSFEGESKIVVEGFDCGSSFLKTAVTNLHFSLAEAT